MSNRSVREIFRKEEIYEVINNCEVCYVGFVDDNKPYVLAFNFGFDTENIYLHTSKTGKKLDIIKKNNNVCVFFDAFRELFAYHEEVACSYRMKYKSVIAWGKMHIVENYDEKVKALNLIMQKYTSKTFNFSKPSIENVCVLRINIELIKGRKFEYL
ncbi:MAG: pyridoxamine 5'-phosphate oxidase family protein [Bacteroidales bacterium]|nr:pyridoxamine 5'-phosphate oxidase family protein [Bacteroidales bacterium]